MSSSSSQYDKLFVITTGPPGSGKGSKLHCLTSMFRVHPRATPFTPNIDSYVENDPEYKEAVQQIVADTGGRRKLATIMRHGKYWQARRKFTEAMGDAYWSSRERTQATEKVDKELLKGIESGRPLIVLETVGHVSTIEWLCGESNPILISAREHGYSVVMMYPYVSTTKLVSRNKSRFFKMLKAGMGARLPPKSMILKGWTSRKTVSRKHSLTLSV